ncbi:uncharacterized protein [Rutidosis leptorrhynchoides]|uniref:uncharacterized protein n=1 Tax=Rutidosis leptorrhynchoides TaxID=125765 RepID=UPI003A99106B
MEEYTKIETPVELLKKIQNLETDHAYLKQKISKLLTISGDRKTDGDAVGVNLTESDCVNILQSMGQSVHMFDLNRHIIYWNQTAQNLFGYPVGEAIGRTAPDLIIEPNYAELATLIIKRAAIGESWSGEFPVRNRNWERFTVFTTLTPSRDENGIISGVLCVCTDARAFRDLRPRSNKFSSAKFGFDPQQPLHTAIVSKISDLASKVKSRMKTGGNKLDNGDLNGVNHHSDVADFVHKHDAFSTGDHFTENGTTDSNGVSENRPAIHKVLSSKAQAIWMGKKGISRAWKSNENEGDGTGRFTWPRLHNNQEQEYGPHSISITSLKVENQVYESTSGSNTNEAPRLWSSSCDPSSSGSGSTNSNYISKFDIDIDNLDFEISWEDLIFGQQIGQGSYGTVCHALWYGSDVAVKIFTKQEYSDDVILAFRKEVSLMKRLRHPNILLFMGAVTSPQHLCIVTEFLPRGSLFRLLQRNTTKLDWRRRVRMAVDIAQGMNYLHHCQPPIIHRDLKSSNLIVDKNWTVKVGDFGLSRIKRETYLTTTTGTGTSQWMAPEILRNEQADEKSDVYSYGVVLWEITTAKIPWATLNSMQVIGAVGFMNQRLEIPKDVDPQWASLIESCWSSEPQFRPTFQEILTQLKDLHKKFVVPRRAVNKLT